MNAYSPITRATGGTSFGAAMPQARVQLAVIRQNSLAQAKLRVLWIVLAFLFVATMALVRIAFLGGSDRAVAATSLEDALLPDRGEIVDRNGVPLARAFPAYALWFNPEALGEDGAPLVRDPATIARELKAIFPDLNEAKVAEQLASGKAGYLRRRVLPEEANRVQDIGELALEILDGRQRVGILGPPRPGDRRRVGAPEAPKTEVPQLRAEEHPSIAPCHANPIRGFSIARQSGQIGAEWVDQLVDVRPAAPGVQQGQRQGGHRRDRDVRHPGHLRRATSWCLHKSWLPPQDVEPPRSGAVRQVA